MHYLLGILGIKEKEKAEAEKEAGKEARRNARKKAETRAGTSAGAAVVAECDETDRDVELDSVAGIH